MKKLLFTALLLTGMCVSFASCDKDVTNDTADIENRWYTFVKEEVDFNGQTVNSWSVKDGVRIFLQNGNVQWVEKGDDGEDFTALTWSYVYTGKEATYGLRTFRVLKANKKEIVLEEDFSYGYDIDESRKAVLLNYKGTDIYCEYKYDASHKVYYYDIDSYSTPHLWYYDKKGKLVKCGFCGEWEIQFESRYNEESGVYEQHVSSYEITDIFNTERYYLKAE